MVALHSNARDPQSKSKARMKDTSIKEKKIYTLDPWNLNFNLRNQWKNTLGHTANLNFHESSAALQQRQALQACDTTESSP